MKSKRSTKINLNLVLLNLNEYTKLEFIYSEKAAKFCEISPLLLSYVVPVKKSKVRWRFCKILWPSQNIWTLKLSFIANLLRKSAAFTVHIHSISTKVWAEFYSDYWSYFLRLHIYLTKNLVSSYLDFLSTFRLTIIKNIEVQISTFFSLWLKVWDPIWNQIQVHQR